MERKFVHTCCCDREASTVPIPYTYLAEGSTIDFSSSVRAPVPLSAVPAFFGAFDGGPEWPACIVMPASLGGSKARRFESAAGA